MTPHTDAVQDPVCGMRLTVEQAPALLEWRGRVYHFCCTACRDAFRLDPRRFAPRDQESAHDHPAR